jgi:cysteine desulfurase
VQPDTVLITLMHANNEIGTIEPIEEFAAIAREAGVLFHTDAVQSVGKVPVDVRRIGADMLSLSAHKLYGPKGIGALYVREGVQLRPILFGGHNDDELRPGTANVPGIVGLGAAAQRARQHLATQGPRLRALRDTLEERVLADINHVRVNGPSARGAGSEEYRVPNTTNLAFDFVEGESLVIALDLLGIACSTGSACSSGAVEPSHVLLSLGLSREKARSSVRISLGLENTERDIESLLQVLPGAVERLRALSPQFAPTARGTAA